MIGISIHIPSVLIGFLIGYVVVSAVFLGISFNENWHKGFSIGWDSGTKYAEDRMKENEKE